MRANLVYEFSCVRERTPVSYIGSTKRHLFQRLAEHANRSARTNKPLSTSPNSSIFDHSVNCSCNISIENFRILGSVNNENSLRILESLYIHRKSPSLNDTQSAHPLLIV